MPDAVPTATKPDLSMPLEDAMRTQRAIRRLRPDPVDDRLVLKLIELAEKAPTGSNAQNWEFASQDMTAPDATRGARKHTRSGRAQGAVVRPRTGQFGSSVVATNRAAGSS